jgi:hypothetical protein
MAPLLRLTVKVSDVARARIGKPHIKERGLQGEGNVGEARAAARRTPSPSMTLEGFVETAC